jgi:hypothetical protein
VNLYRRVNDLWMERHEGRGAKGGGEDGEDSESGRGSESRGSGSAQQGGEVEPPLHVWWALLPPPLDVVVGLRQVHFLARYWTEARGDYARTHARTHARARAPLTPFQARMIRCSRSLTLVLNPGPPLLRQRGDD